jgi:threonyl-tRNA synthetase
MAAPAAEAAASLDDLSLEYNPSNRNTFYAKRVELFEKYQEREQQRIEQARQAAVPIKVVLPDGAVKPAIKNVTTPLDIAAEISKSLAKKVLVAKVDGELWDAFRPLEGDCALQLFSWDDPEGKEVRYQHAEGSGRPGIERGGETAAVAARCRCCCALLSRLGV